MEKKLVLLNKVSEIGKLAAFIDELGEEFNLQPELAFNLNLALEEAVTNVIMYAYPEKVEKEIWLTAVMDEDMLVFTLTDSGKEFDPTEVKEADITLPAEERQLGGLGIFLVRQIMNEVTYQRIEGKNILTLKKRWTDKID